MSSFIFRKNKMPYTTRYIVTIILFFAAFIFAAHYAKGTDREMSWTVPEGVTKIKVISVDPDFTTTLSVQPGQKFTIKAVD
jgi:hypothetical protein